MKWVTRIAVGLGAAAVMSIIAILLASTEDINRYKRIRRM